ncbi:MAG: helix-turn-helix transcriptional regulator [bacterium]
MKKTMFRKIVEKIPLSTKKFVQKQGEIAAQIYKILKDDNITQKEFAKRLDMKESQLSKILAGNANLTLKTITKIEAELGVDVVQIPLFEKDNITVIHKIEISDIKKYSKRRLNTERYLSIPDDLYGSNNMNNYSDYQIRGAA